MSNWNEISINPEEVVELLEELTKHFEMDYGYPSTYVITENGPEHGVVSDDLGLILENSLEMLAALRDDLGMDPDGDGVVIEFELDTSDGEGDGDE